MSGLMLKKLLDKHSHIKDRRKYAEVVAMEYCKKLRELADQYKADLKRLGY